MPCAAALLTYSLRARPRRCGFDLFGDTLESIRPFDVDSQRTTGQLTALDLTAAGEVHLDAEAVQRFRRGYVQAFGTVMDDDPLYTAISSGARYQGMEHWLPLFHDRLETLFDHCGDALYVADSHIDAAYEERLAQVNDYYEARHEALQGDETGTRIIKPLPPEALYILQAEWQDHVAALKWRSLSGFIYPPEDADAVNLQGRAGRHFAAERKQQDVNLFDTVVAHLASESQAGRQVVIIASSTGAQERLASLLQEHGAPPLPLIADWAQLPTGTTPLMAVCAMDNGFQTDRLVLLTEQDILGDRMVRRPGRKKAENFLTEAASLTPGDHVVHVEHGIGRFDGLQTIDVEARRMTA